MKRYISIIILILTLHLGQAFCQGNPAKEPNQAFYQANGYYQQKDYVKALENYKLILGRTSLESGNLYYNIGNSFFKMGKVGYAILFYEKAKRIIPQDSDIRANLSYARSLVTDPGSLPDGKNIALRLIARPFRDVNLNALFISSAILYLTVILILSVFIINPIIRKKLMPLFIVISTVFALTSSACGLRYYDEVMLKAGIVVEKIVEAKYEPIDKSTTYYTLEEGAKVVIIKARPDWQQVRRSDGKTAWIKAGSVGEI